MFIWIIVVLVVLIAHNENLGTFQLSTCFLLALFPDARQKSERSTWYPLFAHAWLPRIFWRTWKLCRTSLCSLRCTTVNHRNR